MYFASKCVSNIIFCTLRRCFLEASAVTQINLYLKLGLKWNNTTICTTYCVIRGRSDKYLAYKRRMKILKKWRFISQHSLLLARYTWPSDAPISLTRWKTCFLEVYKVGLRDGDNLLIHSNFCPASDFFKFWNKKKSHGAKSGEYGGWGSSS